MAEISTNQTRDLWLLNNQLNRSRENENFQYQSDTESTRIEQKIRSPQVKHVRSNSADSSFIDIHGSSTLMSTPKKIKNSNQQNHKKVELNAGEELTIGSELNNYFNHNLSELRKSIKLQNHRKLNMDLSTAEYKCVVGYLGKNNVVFFNVPVSYLSCLMPQYPKTSNKIFVFLSFLEIRLICLVQVLDMLLENYLMGSS